MLQLYCFFFLLQTCLPKTAGTMCRSADYECDLPEYCTGQSEYCPPDIYKMDTEVCDEGKVNYHTLWLSSNYIKNNITYFRHIAIMDFAEHVLISAGYCGV